MIDALGQDVQFSSSGESDSGSASDGSDSASASPTTSGTGANSGSWAAEALLLQQVNRLRQHNKEDLQLKRKAFDAWKVSARLHLRELRREAAEVLLHMLKRGVCRQYWKKWRNKIQRDISARPSMERAWNVAAQEELQRTRDQLAALTLQAEKASLSRRDQEKLITLQQETIYRLQLQRYLLSIILFIIVPSMGVALLSHYVDLHDWEVSTILFLFWICSLVFLFAAGVYVLSKIRENMAANGRERDAGKRKKENPAVRNDKAPVGIRVEQARRSGREAVRVGDEQASTVRYRKESRFVRAQV